MQQMHYVDSYALAKNVFSLFLNMSSDMSGVCSSAGRLWKVLRQQSCDHRSSFWYVVQSVDRRVQIEVATC